MTHLSYSNHLLFNNTFLKHLTPSDDELEKARYLVYESARDWYHEDHFTSTKQIAEKWIRPILNQQSLDIIPDLDRDDDHAWCLVAPWDRETVLGLCYVTQPGVRLDGLTDDGRLQKGQHWMIRAVNHARRKENLDCRWLILTNGVQWRLLDTHSLRRYEAYLEIDLVNLLKGERDDRAAYLFYRLFRLENSFEIEESTGLNLLDDFLADSDAATHTVETYLKTVVSDNLATPGSGDGIMAQLCMGFVHNVDPDRTKTFSEGERDAIYQDATYLLYRLLFILYAEARQLLPMQNADYAAISLKKIIDEAGDLKDHPEKASEKPHYLWDQLKMLFKAIHYSDEYLGIPPYNGGLFEDKDKPYLRAHQISNVYLADALYDLAFLQDDKQETPPERIDYSDLSVRHLGNLYEGMIEYKLFIAQEALLARRVKKEDVKYLPKKDAKQKSTDEVIQPGQVYFAQSPHERKATGTHYTPEELVAKLVHQTVDRVLAARWDAFQQKMTEMQSLIEATPEGPARTRLQTRFDSEMESFVQDQVLSLRICDPAMGSGHFLVYIAHRITNFILEKLSLSDWDNAAVNLEPNYWRRQVVAQCLYGVDISQMAVELAKLSLWMQTMELGLPLTFLNHHLKHGNSLLGISMEEIAEILTADPLNQTSKKTRIAEAEGQYSFQTTPQIVEVLEKARMQLSEMTSQIALKITDVENQEKMYADVLETLVPYKTIGDLLVAQKMGLKVKKHEFTKLAQKFENDQQNEFSINQINLIEKVKKELGQRLTFHWELEFPQVFLLAKQKTLQAGFDVVVGNPPFLGGYKIRGELGVEFLTFLRSVFIGVMGQADLSVYVVRKAYEILKDIGIMGMVVTNSIGQGDTRVSGLAFLKTIGCEIVFADRYIKWPGDALVEVNLIAIARDNLSTGEKRLDGESVPYISSWLDDLPEIEPKILKQNENKAFIGDALRGSGFILSPEEANELLNDKRNRDCVLPYLIGADLNDDPEQKASRFVICFQDWNLEKAQEYPALLSILRNRVKPQRDKVREKSDREYWWRFSRYRKELRNAISDLDRVIVRSSICEYHALAMVPKNQINSKQLVIFAYDDFFNFSILQSNIHEIWLRRFASTMRTDISYTISNCFSTFPFPQSLESFYVNFAEKIGEEYYFNRQEVMRVFQSGLTEIYSHLHNPGCESQNIQEMRDLHARMDQSVMACYGWEDIDLKHGFYRNDRGKMRFMPARDAQREIFTRLIALNHEIAAQEAAEKKKAA